jgi:hypothetical protein
MLNLLDIIPIPAELRCLGGGQKMFNLGIITRSPDPVQVLWFRYLAGVRGKQGSGAGGITVFIHDFTFSKM